MKPHPPGGLTRAIHGVAMILLLSGLQAAVHGEDPQLDPAAGGVRSLFFPGEKALESLHVTRFKLRATAPGDVLPDSVLAAVVYGDSLHFEMDIRVDDTVDWRSKVLRLSGLGASHSVPIEELAGGEPSIGAVYTVRAGIAAMPPPVAAAPLPFLSTELYPLEFSVAHARGGEGPPQRIGEVSLKGLFHVSDSIRCLTGNPDLEPSRRITSLVSVDFPEPRPSHHPSGSGNVRSELTDGLFSGSNSPGWESISWKGGWGGQSGIVELRFDRVRDLHWVVGVCPRPYGNYRTDRLVVRAASSNGFEPVGSVAPVETGGFQLLFARLEGVRTSDLRLEFHQDAGANQIVLSEVYVFGH